MLGFFLTVTKILTLYFVPKLKLNFTKIGNDKKKIYEYMSGQNNLLWANEYWATILVHKMSFNILLSERNAK